MLALKIFMQNERDFVDVILLHRKRHLICRSSNTFLYIREFLFHVSIGETLHLNTVAVKTHLYTKMKFLQS